MGSITMSNMNYDGGQFLKSCRVKRGMSQIEFGKLMGFEDSILTRIENGKRNMKYDELVKYSQILDIDLNELLVRFNFIDVTQTRVTLSDFTTTELLNELQRRESERVVKSHTERFKEV